MKKLVVLGMLAVGMCFLTACGEEESLLDTTTGRTFELQEATPDEVQENEEQELEFEESDN